MSTTTDNGVPATKSNTAVVASTKPAPIIHRGRGSVWDEFADMRRQMDDLFNRAFGFTPATFPSLPALPTLPAPYAYEPPIDLTETDDRLTLVATVPGFVSGEIQVEATDDYITINGEHKVPKEPKGIAHRKSGVTEESTFSVSLTLPVAVQPSKIKATLANGMLTISMPKTEASRRNSVKVPVQG